MIALDGDKFVGLSAISYSAEEQIGYIMISGVDRAYRNQKIMQALKLRAINYARAKGATSVVTHVETVNATMRHINQKFGFLEEPGKYEMEKKL